MKYLITFFSIFLFTCTLWSQDIFIEERGLVVMEIENEPITSDWKAETSDDGYFGKSYYRWNGGDYFGSAPSFGEMTYQFKIQHGGTYEIYIHNRRDADAYDEANDCWFKMNNGSYEKMYGDPESWKKWGYKMHIEHGTNSFQLSEGYHTIYIKPRSFDFKMDRIIVKKTDATYPYDSPTLRESKKEGTANLVVNSTQISPNIIDAASTEVLNVNANIELTGEGNYISNVILDMSELGLSDITLNHTGYSKYSGSHTLSGSLTPGTYSLPLKVTDNSGSEYTSNISITVVATDNNAWLKNLTVSEGNLSKEFQSDELSYDLTILNTVSTLQITPHAMSSSYHSITVAGNNTASGTASSSIDVSASSGSFNIVVTAGDEATQKTYTINYSHIEKPVIYGKQETFTGGYGEAHWGWNPATEEPRVRQTLTHSVVNNELLVDIDRDASSPNGSLGFEGLEYDFYHLHVLDFSAKPVMILDVKSNSTVDLEIALWDVDGNYKTTQITQTVIGDNQWHTLTYNWEGYNAADHTAIREFLINFSPGWQRSFTGEIHIDNIKIGSVIESLDLTALTSLVTTSASLHDNAIEGSSDGQYPAGSKETFKVVIDRASAVLNDTEANQTEVDWVYDELLWAKADFQASVNGTGPVTDFAALQTLVNQCETQIASATVGTEAGTYPQLAVDNFQSAINSAKTILNNSGATQNQVDNAHNSLSTAKSTFESSINQGNSTDFTALQTLVTNSETLIGSATAGSNDGDYPQSAINNFQTAINNAKAVLNNSSANQTEADNAVTNLTAAKTTFEGERIQTSPTDYSGLQTIISQCEDLLSNAQIGSNNGEYSQTVVSTFQSAIDDAKAVLNNSNATQATVDAAEIALNNAQTTFKAAKIIINNLDINNLDVNVFPNPAYDRINICSVNSMITAYQIYNITGACIMSGICSSNEITIDVSNMKKGIYIINTLNNDMHVSSSKFLIEK